MPKVPLKGVPGPTVSRLRDTTAGNYLPDSPAPSESPGMPARSRVIYLRMLCDIPSCSSTSWALLMWLEGSSAATTLCYTGTASATP
jgi:hypothetical protein